MGDSRARTIVLVAALTLALGVAVGSFALWRGWEVRSTPGSPAVPVTDLRAPDSTVAVPNVVHQPESEATGALAAAGLQSQVARRASVSEPVGNVLAQDPDPGTVVPRQAVVHLVVSTGPVQ